MSSSILGSVWFVLLGALLAGYAILDGLDLGVGIVLPFVAKNEQQRGSLFTAIGPFWAGYEVWLVAAGGAMIAAFPRLYADSFSGFYLVLTLVLWLLIARGGSIEFRNSVDDPMWRSFWDFVFCASSTLLALLFGAAFGNVIRGVPLDAKGNFQGTFGMALNPYAIGVGLTAVAVLALHGGNFIAKRAEGALREQGRRVTCRLYPVAVALVTIVSAASFIVRRDLADNFLRRPELSILPICALAGIVACGAAIYRRSESADTPALLCGGAAIGLLMATAGISLYPRLLPAYGIPSRDLTIANCAAPTHNLFTALLAYAIAMVFILIYTTYIHQVFKGRMRPTDGYHH